MTFTRTQVGFSNNDAPLYEYRLDGTPYIVCRIRPDLGRGPWSIYNEDTDRHLADSWHLADAKAIAIRYANRAEN